MNASLRIQVTATPDRVLSYPGWIIGFMPDYATTAEFVANGRNPNDLALYTVDGETFQESPDGLKVVKGPDSTHVLRGAFPKIDAKYPDSVVYVFGITYDDEGSAVDLVKRYPRNYIFYPSDLSGIDLIEKGPPPRQQSLRGDASAVGASHAVELARRVDYVHPGGGLSTLPSALCGLPVYEDGRRVRERPIRNHSRLVTFPPVLRSVRLEPVTPPQAPGRNDPCSCGSGKKYKKCCLHKGKQ